MTKKFAKEYAHLSYPHEEGIHVLVCPLDTTKSDDDVLYKRFGIIGHIHNVVVKHAKRLLYEFRHDDKYKPLISEYAELKKTLSDDDFKKTVKPVIKQMNAIRKHIGLTEYGFQAYAKKENHMFSKNISSQQIQKEASRVWEGVEKVLFSDGETIHFKPYREISTICGKSPKNGVQLFSKYHNHLNDKTPVLYDSEISWNGLIIKVKMDYDDPYVRESLKHNVKYCEIKRMMFSSGWRYYVAIYLEGNAPLKIMHGKAPMCEIDPGVSTMAVYSEKELILCELAPDAKSYQKKIFRLQSQIDDCKMRMNPDNYNADGTIKKGKHEWELSKTAKRKQRMITVLNRKEAASRRCSHNRLANDIIKISPDIRLEPMDYKALQKRSKKTERSDKSVEINKNGVTKSVRKYKRKKRFGTSCRTRAPSMFVSILERKALRYGGSVSYIDTRTLKPSQYDHVSDTFVKTDLNKRSKTIGGHEVQRDLYSAFLGYCVKPDGKTFDHKKADTLFEKFVIAQNKLISDMKARGISMPQCFGF